MKLLLMLSKNKLRFFLQEESTSKLLTNVFSSKVTFI